MGAVASSYEAMWCGSCTGRTNPPEFATARDSSFGALAYADPVDLCAAWVAAREDGDVKFATAFCAEDLRFESDGDVEIIGRDAVAERLFAQPAPSISAADMLHPLHLVGKSDYAFIVAREFRMRGFILRQEFTVISLFLMYVP